MNTRSGTLSSPPPGGGGRPAEALAKAGREGVNREAILAALSPHPGSLRSPTLPLQGRVKEGKGAR